MLTWSLYWKKLVFVIIKIEINKDTPSGYSLFTHCSYHNTKKVLIIIEVKTTWKYFVNI